ncbi:MAG: hypothetical protein ABII72_04230 [Parcubacteria group bacterium]
MSREESLDLQRETLSTEAKALFDVLNKVVNERMLPVWECDGVKTILDNLTTRADSSNLWELVVQPLQVTLGQMRVNEKFSRDIRQTDLADRLKELIAELEQTMADIRKSK